MMVTSDCYIVHYFYVAVYDTVLYYDIYTAGLWNFTELFQSETC